MMIKMEDRIRPNDVVLHKPTGEKWVVAGVHYDGRTLIPMGYPFPSIANTADCELLERHYEGKPQDENTIKILIDRGLESYIDARSAMFHGILGKQGEKSD